MTRRRHGGWLRRPAEACKTVGARQTSNTRTAVAAALVIALVLSGICLQTDVPWSTSRSAGSSSGSIDIATGPADKAADEAGESTDVVSGLYGQDAQPGRSSATQDVTGEAGVSSSVAEAFAQLTGPVGDDGCAKAEVTLAENVPDAAADLLRAYRRRRDCLPAQCGYLDLYGEAWGCVIQGDGWVDVCVVRGEQEGQKSVLTVVRMDGAAWAMEVGTADVGESLSLESGSGEGESG